MSDVTLTIDGIQISVPRRDDVTLLKAAAATVGIDIPTICYHEACTANGLCRMCVVEVEKQRLLQPSCIVHAGVGMVVHTRNERVERSRRTIVEMLDSAVDLADAPEIQAQMRRLRRRSSPRFPTRSAASRR